MVVVGVLHHNANQMVKEVSGGIGRKGGEGEEDYSQPVQGLILQDGERGGGVVRPIHVKYSTTKDQPGNDPPCCYSAGRH